MINSMKKHLAGIGVLISFFGFIFLYLSIYGTKIAYTHTYYYVTQIIPLAVDWSMFNCATSSSLMLLFFAGVPPSLKVIIRLEPNIRLRRILIVLGLVMLVIVAIAFLQQGFFPNHQLSVLTQFVFMLPATVAGTLLIILAAYPAKLVEFAGSTTQNLVYRLFAFALAFVLAIMLISIVELKISDPPDNQILAPLSGNSSSNSTATHYIFFTLNPHIRDMKVGESVKVEAIFKILDKSSVPNPNTDLGAYPISLDPTHNYEIDFIRNNDWS